MSAATAGGSRHPRRSPALVFLAVAAALLVVAAGLAVASLVTGESDGGRDARAARFVAELRTGAGAGELRAMGDETLVAHGRRFCADLARRGSSLEVVNADVRAGRVYAGQNYVVRAARAHLCPGTPDRAT